MERSLYDEFSDEVDRRTLAESSRELSYLYKVLDGLHTTVARSLTVDELEASFWQQYPEAKKDLYTGLFTDLRSLQIGEDVGRVLLNGIKGRKAALKLSETAYLFTQGLKSIDDVQQCAAELGNSPVEDVEFKSVSTDLEQLITNVVTTPGLRWRLDCLNKSLGSLRPGDFGFIFARPETGKTTFLASEISYMLKQAKTPIIHFNFEESGEKVMLRYYQAYFGATVEQLMANAKAYKKKFYEEVGDRFILVDDAGSNRSSAERIIGKVRPALVVFDPLDKLQGFKADRDDLVYGAIYQWAREIAKKYCPVIGISQADGTGEGVKWLTMANVSNAKTSKQAEADFILGIGRSHDEAAESIRYFNISKNKLIGDKDTIGSLRHGRMEVLIKPEQAQYQDIIKYS